jgi:flagellar biosynthesis protein FlhA
MLLGMVPAMPQLVVLPAAAVAGAIYWTLRKAEKAPLRVVEPITDAAPSHLIEWHEVADVAPITLDLGYGLVSLVDERKGAALMGRVTAIRRQLSREFGFVMPVVKVADDLSLPGNAYQIRISGVLVGEDQAWANELLALDSGDCLEGITGRAVKDPSFGLDALWIAERDRTDAVAAGYTVVDPATVIATHLNQLVSTSAAELFGMDDAQALINNLKESYPQLAAGLTPMPYTLAAVTTLCRALLAERVPLRDFRRIAEAMVDLAPRNLEMNELVEAVRQRLGGLIVQTIVPVKMPLPAITFDSALESLLVQSVQSAPQASWPFEPELARRIISVIDEAVQPMLVAARSFAIITSPLCRAAVGRLLRAQYSDVAVLSFLEIPETKKVEVIAVVGGIGQLPEPDAPQEIGEPYAD